MPPEQLLESPPQGHQGEVLRTSARTSPKEFAKYDSDPHQVGEEVPERQLGDQAAFRGGRRLRTLPRTRDLLFTPSSRTPTSPRQFRDRRQLDPELSDRRAPAALQEHHVAVGRRHHVPRNSAAVCRDVKRQVDARLKTERGASARAHYAEPMDVQVILTHAALRRLVGGSMLASTPEFTRCAKAPVEEYGLQLHNAYLHPCVRHMLRADRPKSARRTGPGPRRRLRGRRFATQATRPRTGDDVGPRTGRRGPQASEREATGSGPRRRDWLTISGLVRRFLLTQSITR